MRKLSAIVAMLAFTVITASRGHAIVSNPDAIDRPDGKGDQLIFYYDARPGFTTFLNLHNDSVSDLEVQVLFYGPTFSSPFTTTVGLDAGTTHIIDVGSLKTGEPALPAQFGVAIATAVDNHGKPLVTRALSGNFTVANLLVNSAWGAAAAARSATQTVEAIVDPTIPSTGTLIDGNTVRLRPIQPSSAHLATYYDPDSLESPSSGGNQLIFVTFEDVPGDTYSAQVGVTSWFVDARRSNGAAIGSIPNFLASGVVVTDLASVAGTAVNGASGSMTFSTGTSAAPLNRLVFFNETLGTFATGYLLPPIVSEILL